jgi:hypothetical protein
LQLFGAVDEGLRELRAVLDFDLPFDLDVSEYSEGTPFVTPYQGSRAAVISALDTPHLGVASCAAGQFALLDEPLDEDAAADFEDMSSVQLAVLGTTAAGRWDGTQGPGYWRRRPNMKEAIASQLRAVGATCKLQISGQCWRTRWNPLRVPFAWLQKLKQHLAPEVTNASKDQFPSATLTAELAEVALGHLATDVSYVVKLRDSLAEALPLACIATAGSYTPSRASGMLIPVQRPTAVLLSAADQRDKKDLEDMLKVMEIEQSMVCNKHQIQLKEYEAARDSWDVYKICLTDAEARQAAPQPDDDMEELGRAVNAARQDVTRSAALKAQEEERLKEVSKQYRQVVSA